MSYQPIERQKLYELIADQLLRRISERQLQPGRPAADRARADAGVPRRPLVGARGAADARVEGRDREPRQRHLRRRGYANPLNSSVQLLLSLDQATMLDVYELRRILECEAAGLAAERHADAHLGLMDAAIEEMAVALASDDANRGDALHRRRPPVPSRDRRGNAKRRLPARDGCAARSDSARADVDLPRSGQPRALARAASRDPRCDRSARLRRSARRRCARISYASSPTSTTRSRRFRRDEGRSDG